MTKTAVGKNVVKEVVEAMVTSFTVTEEERQRILVIFLFADVFFDLLIHYRIMM